MLTTAVAALLTPLLGRAWDAGLLVRGLIAVAVVTPIGFVLGQPFVGALDWLRRHAPERLPWAIGINAFASVIASVAVVPLAMAAGYTGVLLAGLALYALALLCTLALED